MLTWNDTDQYSYFVNKNWVCNITSCYNNKWYWEVAHVDSFTDPLDNRIYTGTSNTREDGKLMCENKLKEVAK